MDILELKSTRTEIKKSLGKLIVASSRRKNRRIEERIGKPRHN